MRTRPTSCSSGCGELLAISSPTCSGRARRRTPPAKGRRVIVRRVQDPGRVVHDGASTSPPFRGRSSRPARLAPRRTLVVVFGHSDPDAWRKLLVALHEAGYVVTSSGRLAPSRPTRASPPSGSPSRLAAGWPADRPVATAAEVDREAAEFVKMRVPGWNRDGLALGDQMMAAYGPVMEVYGRYSQVIEPDGAIASVDRYLTLARRAVREATALRLESLPLETFDALTRFAFMWMKLHGRTLVPKGEARFLAQADSLNIEDIRGHLVSESSTGFRLVLDPPEKSGTRERAVRRRPGHGRRIHRDRLGWRVARRSHSSERPPDDEHLWALIGWLANELPASDPIAKAVAAIIRNGGTIRNAAKGIRSPREEAKESGASDAVHADGGVLMPGIAHWADILRLRDEVTRPRVALGDLQMSLYSAVVRRPRRSVPRPRLLLRHHRADPRPHLLHGHHRPPARRRRDGRAGAVPPRPGHGRRQEPRARGPLPPREHARRPSWPPSSASGCGREAEQRGPIDLAGTKSRRSIGRQHDARATSPEFGPATTLYERFLWGLFDGDQEHYRRHAARGPNKAPSSEH